MPRLIISTTGSANAGKSSAIEPWIRQKTIGHIRGSQLIESAAAREGIELSKREDYALFHKKYRALPGNETFIADAALSDPHVLVIIDGLRNIRDAMKLEKAKDVAHLIVKFWAPLETRFNRTSPDDLKNAQTFDEFIAQQADEYGTSSDLNSSHIKAVSDMASYTIDTSVLNAEQSKRALTGIIRLEAAIYAIQL